MARRIGLVSLHTSPLAGPGARDAGGMNVYLNAVGRALAASGHEVEFVTRREDVADPAVEDVAPGLRMRRVDAGPPTTIRKEALPAVTAAFGAALAEAIDRGQVRYDVLHAHYWLSGAACLALAEAGIPLAVTLHTVAALKDDRARAAGRAEREPAERWDAERRLVADADALVAIGPAEARAIEHHYRPGRAIDLAPPGVDSSLFHPADSADPDDPADPGDPGIGEDAGSPTVLLVGRVQPLKGAELAVDAVARIPESRRPVLVLAGGPTPGQEAFAAGLRERARSAGVVLRDLGTLSRPEVARQLRRATVLIVPSETETFGLVALEAAASGTPVLAADVDGLRDSVRPGVSGELVPGRSPAEWAERLDRLLGDPARRRELSRTATRFARAHGWDGTARALERVYERLVPRTEERA